jgi:integrase
MHDTDVSIALTVATGHHRAAVLLAATSGLRCIELARLRWIDVLDDRLLLHGKGSKDRIVPLHPAARAALDDLPRTTEYVLPWRGHARSPGDRVSREVNAFLHAIGINETAHTLRHWCATKAYQNTRDLRAVQELLGHASIANTAIYAAFDVEHLRSVVESIPVPIAGPSEPSPAPSAPESVPT